MLIGWARAGPWFGPAPHSNAPSSSRPNPRGAGGAQWLVSALLQLARIIRVGMGRGATACLRPIPYLMRECLSAGRGRGRGLALRPTPTDQTHAAQAGHNGLRALLQLARIIRVVGMGCEATACLRPAPARHQAPAQTHAARAGPWFGPAPHSNAPSSSRPNSRGAGGTQWLAYALLQRALQVNPDP